MLNISNILRWWHWIGKRKTLISHLSKYTVSLSFLLSFLWEFNFWSPVWCSCNIIYVFSVCIYFMWRSLCFCSTTVQSLKCSLLIMIRPCDHYLMCISLSLSPLCFLLHLLFCPLWQNKPQVSWQMLPTWLVAVAHRSS